jgi:RNA polymerase sigma-70 factor (ECF subfamily)
VDLGGGGQARPLADRFADSGTSPSERCRREEDLRDVREALDALGPADREVLVLRHLEGRSFAEVAAALGITENAAKVRHFRALGRMRNLMDDGSPG